MKYFDIKPQPKTALECWEYWLNDMASQFVTASYAGGTKIEVTEATETENWEYEILESGSRKVIAVF